MKNNDIKVKRVGSYYKVYTGDVFGKDLEEIWETNGIKGKEIDETRYYMKEISRKIYASYDMWDGDVCTGMWAKLGQKWYECRVEET